MTGLGTPIANVLVPALAGYQASQPPAISAPISVAVNENSSLGFTGGNAISVSDAGGSAEQLTLTVSHATLESYLSRLTRTRT